MQQRQSFVASALEAESEVAQNHLVYDADDVFRYIRAKVEGRSMERPQAVTLK